MNVTTLLSDLVLVNSVYPNEQGIGRFIEQELESSGFIVRRQKVSEGRFNILAERLIPNTPVILLFAHMDTVDELPGWHSDPYKLTKKGDKLYGLGAWDMKAGLAAILAATNDLKNLRCSIKLAFTVDEENVSVGMNTIIKSGWLDDVNFAITPEPGFVHGLAGIALGRTGRAVYQMTINTTGGHVYLAEENANAITETRKVLDVLEKLKLASHPKLGKSILFPRYIKGGTQAMSIPSKIDLEIESQLVPPETSQTVLNQIKKALHEAKEEGALKAEVTVDFVKRPTPFCEPFAIDENINHIQNVSSVLASVINTKPIIYYRRSVGDENRVARLGIPVVTVGPDGGNAHQPDEWVSEKSLLLLVEFFKSLIKSYGN